MQIESNLKPHANNNKKGELLALQIDESRKES